MILRGHMLSSYIYLLDIASLHILSENIVHALNEGVNCNATKLDAHSVGCVRLFKNLYRASTNADCKSLGKNH